MKSSRRLEAKPARIVDAWLGSALGMRSKKVDFLVDQAVVGRCSFPGAICFLVSILPPKYLQ